MDAQMLMLTSAACGALLGAGAVAIFLQRRSVGAQVQARLAIERAETAESARDVAQQQLAEARTDAARHAERVAMMQAQMQDWETQKQRFNEIAQAAALNVTRELSGKLLEDHQREREAARKETEEATRKNSEGLMERFEGITKAVAALDGLVQDSRGKVDSVWQALTSPGGAGYYAEVGLENLFKSFGLAAGRDFDMQYAMKGEDGALRPDALLYLPADTLMVVDSKASKFLIDSFHSDGASVEEARANLARSMNTHLKALAAKDYKSAVQKSFRAQGRGEQAQRILSVMYLPSESAFQTLAEADGEFLSKAHKADILVVGPCGLSGLISLVSRQIDVARQAENHQQIVDHVQDLLEAIAVALEKAGKAGRGLRTASDAFEEFVSSVNRRLLPRARRISDLGIRPARSKALPDQLPGFHVVTIEEPAQIESLAVEEPTA